MNNSPIRQAQDVSPAQLDLIAIGDSTIDTFIKIHDAALECDINHQDCKISVPYGAKIPVDSIAYGVAGNAANVAVACKRLGLATAIYTNLGDDRQGETILEAFKKEGVDTRYVKINKGRGSNLSVVLTFQGERTIFVYHQDWFYTLPDIDTCSWVYLTSLAETFTNSNILGEVLRFLEKYQAAKMVFAPGTYQLKADVKRFPRVLEKCTLLILNLREAKQVLEIEQTEIVQIKDILSGLLMLGPQTAVVTDGEEGSYATDGRDSWRLGIIPTQIVEKTGAGDAYASGLVAALAHGEPLSEAMVWGSINAASCMKEVGTQNGLLSEPEIIEKRKAMPEFSAVKF